jgi:uncharacterized protein DUF6471
MDDLGGSSSVVGEWEVNNSEGAGCRGYYRGHGVLRFDRAAIGVTDTAVNLRNKVARGRFSATFLVQCLTAIGARALRLSEDTDGQ